MGRAVPELKVLLVERAVPLLLIALTVVVLLPATHVVQHSDEGAWITVGHYYTRLLLEDWSVSAWACAQCGTFGDLNPHLGKWLIGVPVVIDQGLFNDAVHFESCIDCSAAERARVAPPAQLLAVARALPIAFSGLNIALLYGLARRVTTGVTAGVTGGALAAALVAGLLAASWTFRWTGGVVLTDPFYLCFLLLACLATTRAIATAEAGPGWRRAAAVGVAVGLAGSVKVSGLVIGGATFALSTLPLVLGGRWSARRWLQANAVGAGAALLVVYALNPWLWPWLGGGWDPSRLAELPWMFHRWQVHLEQIGFSYQGLWQGDRLATLHHMLLAHHTWWPVSVLAALGCARVVRDLVTRRDSHGQSAVALAFLVVNYTVIAAFMEVNWPRFYMPTVLALHLTAAIGLTTTATWLKTRLTNR